VDFINKVAPYAQKVARDYNILASLIIAQSCLESHFAESGLALKANNLFGIKGSYNGQSIVMPTTEYKDDVPYHIMAPFRKYPSFLESLQDLGKLYKNGVSWDRNKYKSVLGEKNYKKAAHAVKNSGYCTDPHYSDKLISLIDSFKLTRFDTVNKPTFTGTLKLGDRGGQVKLIQQKLGVTADGIFGVKTAEAVKNFQRKNNLVVDSIVGPKTWNKLF